MGSRAERLFGGFGVAAAVLLGGGLPAVAADEDRANNPRKFDEVLGPLNAAPFCDVSEDAFRFTVPGTEIPRRCFAAPNGLTRCYFLYVPDCTAEEGPVPLVYDLTPYGLCPSTYAQYSGWAQRATEECFAVVWPVANTRPDDADFICWELPGGVAGLDPSDPSKETSDCCCAGPTGEASSVTPEDTKDLEFLRAIGTDLQGVAPIDPARIYATGHSNGCYAASALAMQASDYVAAIACMSALWLTPPSQDYSATPLWILMGEQDAVDPYEGTDAEGNFRPSFGVAFEALSEINGCTGRSTEERAIPEMDVDSLLLQKSGVMRLDQGTGCENNATVAFVTLTTAGHTPFLRAPEVLPPSFRAAKTTIDTTAMAWEFLSSYALETPPPEFL